MPAPCWSASVIADQFEAIFDIIAADLEPKPAQQTYDKFLAPARRRSGLRQSRVLTLPGQIPTLKKSPFTTKGEMSRCGGYRA
jgi:hypothetical protein